LLKMKRKRSKKKIKDIWSLKRWNFQPIEPTNHLNLQICNSRKKRNEKVLMKSRPLILIPDWGVGCRGLPVEKPVRS
jgi:hypothetical protein